MIGHVQQAVQASVPSGTVMPTPTDRAQFIVHIVDADGVVLLFGPKKTPTRFGWPCLEGVVEHLRRRGWVLVGANRDLAGNMTTLDGYLMQHVPRQTANYVAVLLNRAGVVELSPEVPARVRLRHPS